MTINKLKLLEKKSIEIIKSVYNFVDPENIALLYSCGKDSTVLLHLIKKSKVKLPIMIHIDTNKKFKKMIQYRNKIFSNLNCDNIVIESNYSSDNKAECCQYNKVSPLNDIIYNLNNFDRFTVINNKKIPIQQNTTIQALFVGIRRDEEKSRCKEEYISKRYKNSWDIESSELQINNFYSFDINDEVHLRIHPLLDWTELDIWEYIKQENIDIIDLYFSKNGYRYRSLGCKCCTQKIKSNAVTVSQIIMELKQNLSNVEERSTRLQDNKNGLEQLRINGYM